MNWREVNSRAEFKTFEKPHSTLMRPMKAKNHMSGTGEGIEKKNQKVNHFALQRIRKVRNEEHDAPEDRRASGVESGELVKCLHLRTPRPLPNPVQLGHDLSPAAENWVWSL